MFSIVQRFQHVLNFSLTLVGFISAFIAASSWLQLYNVEVPSTLNNVKPTASMRFNRMYGGSVSKGKENTKLTFDLESDLTPLFNWNTKQVFVYLTAEYPGRSQTSSNKVTYWDKIITTKDKAKLSLNKERAKYSVWDIEDSFQNKEAIVKLEWNIQPWVGPLIYGATESNYTINFPDPVSDDEKQRQKEKKKRVKQQA